MVNLKSKKQSKSPRNSGSSGTASPPRSGLLCCGLKFSRKFPFISQRRRRSTLREMLIMSENDHYESGSSFPKVPEAAPKKQVFPTSKPTDQHQPKTVTFPGYNEPEPGPSAIAAAADDDDWDWSEDDVFKPAQEKPRRYVAAKHHTMREDALWRAKQNRVEYHDDCMKEKLEGKPKFRPACKVPFTERFPQATQAMSDYIDTIVKTLGPAVKDATVEFNRMLHTVGVKDYDQLFGALRAERTTSELKYLVLPQNGKPQTFWYFKLATKVSNAVSRVNRVLCDIANFMNLFLHDSDDLQVARHIIIQALQYLLNARNAKVGDSFGERPTFSWMEDNAAIELHAEMDLLFEKAERLALLIRGNYDQLLGKIASDLPPHLRGSMPHCYDAKNRLGVHFARLRIHPIGVWPEEVKEAIIEHESEQHSTVDFTGH